MTAPRVGLVGVGGYGRVHLQHLLDFEARGELKFAAAVVLPPETDADLLQRFARIGCEVLPDFAALLVALPRLRLDLCVVPTPIHLHATMTVALLAAGVHVLVEKPVAASLAEVERISAAARENQRVVAVGFQYLHAPEISELKDRIIDGALGPLRRVCVHAAWPRSHAYYSRNAWAGRLRLGSDWVLDSPVNNAMSHFLMLMLFLTGSREHAVAEPVALSAELYRAQPIESFDTAVLHLDLPGGCRLDFYGTHSSRDLERPSLILEGADGRAEWVQDSHATIEAAVTRWHQPARAESDTRERMLRAVLDRIQGGTAFVCTPEHAAAHVRCVTALQRVPITPVPLAFRAEHTINDAGYTFVPGLNELLRRAAHNGVGLAAVGATWAATPVRTSLGDAAGNEISTTLPRSSDSADGEPRREDLTGT